MWYQQNEQTDENIECQMPGQKGSLLKEYHSNDPFSWSVVLSSGNIDVKSIFYTVQDQTIEFLCRNNSAVLVQNDHYSTFQTWLVASHLCQ